MYHMNSKFGTCRTRFLDLTFHAVGFPYRWAVQLHRRIVFDPAGGFVIRQFAVRCWQPWWRYQWLLRNSSMADEWATGRVFELGLFQSKQHKQETHIHCIHFMHSHGQSHCGRHLSHVDTERERLCMRCQKRAQKPCVSNGGKGNDWFPRLLRRHLDIHRH